jgi:hypothetical protein
LDILEDRKIFWFAKIKIRGCPACSEVTKTGFVGPAPELGKKEIFSCNVTRRSALLFMSLL